MTAIIPLSFYITLTLTNQERFFGSEIQIHSFECGRKASKNKELPSILHSGCNGGEAAGLNYTR